MKGGVADMLTVLYQKEGETKRGVVHFDEYTTKESTPQNVRDAVNILWNEKMHDISIIQLITVDSDGNATLWKNNANKKRIETSQKFKNKYYERIINNYHVTSGPKVKAPVLFAFPNSSPLTLSYKYPVVPTLTGMKSLRAPFTSDILKL